MRLPRSMHPGVLVVAWVSAILADPLFGQTAVWTGMGANENYTTPANWQGGVVPGNSGSTTLNLDLSVAQRSIMVNTAANVAGLYFYNPSGGYGYSIYNGSGTLTIGAGGVSFQNGVDAYFDFFVPVVLSHSAGVSGGTTYYTAFYSNISETGGPSTLTTNGRIYLFGENSFSGGLTVQTGTVYLGTSTAAGSGGIIAGDNTQLQSVYNPVTLTNTLSLGNNVTLGNNGFASDLSTLPQLTFSGTVTLQNAATTVYLNGNTSVDLKGNLTGPASSAVSVIGQGIQLPYDGGSQLVVEGSTSNSITSISIYRASLILAPTGVANSSFSGIGGSGLVVGNSDQPAYLGLDGSFTAAGAVTTFLSAHAASIGPVINGTLGFDTFANSSSPNVFVDPVDLHLFSSGNFVGLGSESSAILDTTALITPNTQLYKFGGGGGTLTVKSALADSGGATALVMNAGSEPLTLILQGANSYTGGTTVNSGALIFDSALPTSGAVTVEPGAYVGYTENASNVANAGAFIGMLTFPGSGAIIGFDSSSVASPRPTIADAIDLSGFGLSSLFIGTATKVTLSGPITPPASAGFQFTGIKGGNLTIASNLTGAGTPVTIGLANPIETNGGTSIVNLTGTNTYGGGTTFNSGTLFIFYTSSLGTGPLSIPDMGTALFTPYLAPFGGSLTLPNNISLGNMGPQPGVNVGDSYAADNLHPLVLSGTISDASMPGVLGITGPVTLSGVNTYSGGTVITSNNSGFTQINVTNSSSLGTGPLTVNDNGALVAPVADVTLANGIVLNSQLTLGAPGNTYKLTLNGIISGYGGLDIESNVALGGANTYSGSTVINDATVAISGPSPFGSSLVTLNGSTLSFASGNQTFLDLQGNSSSALAIGPSSMVTLTTDSTSMAYTFAGNITGDASVSLVKSGSQAQILSGTNTYGGGTTVNAGSLIAGSGQALGTGPVTVTYGATLGVSSGATVSNALTANTGATLAGSGTFTVTGISFSGGTTVAPGNIPGQQIGTLDFSNSVTFGSGGTFVFNLSDAGGAAGVGYSTVGVGGTLTVTSTPGSPFTVNLVSLDGSWNPGLATFSATSTYSWTLLSAASISGFAAGDFSLNTSGFQNSTTGGLFSFAQNGNAIDLNFTPVPEPSTWALMMLGAGGLLFVCCTKRFNVKALGRA